MIVVKHKLSGRRVVYNWYCTICRYGGRWTAGPHIALDDGERHAKNRHPEGCAALPDD